MKVLVISHMYPCVANEVYGIFVHEQVKTLSEKGLDVTVVSPTACTPFPVSRLRRKWKKQSQIPQQATWDNIEVHYPRYVVFPRAWLFCSSGMRMYRGIRRLVKDIYQAFPFDLIHAHVALPDGYAGALVSCHLGVPLVITIHGQDLQHTVHRGAHCRESLSLSITRASRVIVVSQKLGTLAEKYFQARAKTTVIGNGIDPREVVSVKESALRRSESSATLLSASNLITTKGIDLNLAAVQRLHNKYPSLLYRVIGTGPDRASLARMVCSLGLNDCVEFTGRQPHQQVMKEMSRCDIFSLPSWNEGFGVVYLEAMAHGKPVIGCQGEGIEDVIENGKTGILVKPRDVDSLVEALDYLLSHPEEAKSMGERARQLVLENYTWEKNAEKTIQIYREVLSEI